MHAKIYTFLLCFIGFNTLLSGQQTGTNWCGYTGFSPWLDWYQRNTGLFAQEGADTAWLHVPVTLHIVGTDAGTSYYPFDEALRAVCDMNEQYAPLYVRFYLMPGDGVRYHANSRWLNHDWSDGSDMIQTATAGIKNRLNAFIVSDPAGNCGYSWHDAIVLAKGCSGNGNSTWAHEAGHHFSLPHPFSGWEDFEWNYTNAAPAFVNGREVEKADQSNCYKAGDRFCDTDPDYLNFRWQCSGDSRSSITQHDPNSTTFRSDGSLYMGYANDECASRFTLEQIDAIRANLKTEHSSYLQATNPMLEIDDDAQVQLVSPIDTFEAVQFDHIDLKWNPVPNARYYVVEVSNSKYFNPKLLRQTVIDDTSLLIPKPMPNLWTLYWRVKAYGDWDICQPNEGFQTGSFRTQNLSATNELERSAVIELAPNPVVAGVPAMLNIMASQTMDISIKVCDAAGRLCLQQESRLFSGENQIELPTENLSTGAYSVLIQNEKGATVKRLAVIQY